MSVTASERDGAAKFVVRKAVSPLGAATCVLVGLKAVWVLFKTGVEPAGLTVAGLGATLAVLRGTAGRPATIVGLALAFAGAAAELDGAGAAMKVVAGIFCCAEL